jgi:WD40 repeat protein
MRKNSHVDPQALAVRFKENSLFYRLPTDLLQQFISYLDIEAIRNLTSACIVLMGFRSRPPFLASLPQFYYPRPYFFGQPMQMNYDLPADRQYPPTSLLFLQNHRYLVGSRASVAVFDSNTGDAVLSKNLRILGNIIQNAGKTVIAAVVNEFEKKLLVTDSNTFQPLFSLKDRDLNEICALSSNGECVFYAKKNVIHIRNIVTNIDLRSFTQHKFSSVDDLAVSPDDRWVVSTHSTHARYPVAVLVALLGEEQRFSFDHPNTIVAVKFSPDSQYLITAMKDGQVFVWDIVKRECTQRFYASGQKINDMTVSTRTDGSVWVVVVAEKSSSQYCSYSFNPGKNFEVVKIAQELRVLLQEPTLYAWNMQNAVCVLQYNFFESRKGWRSYLELSDADLYQKLASSLEFRQLLHNTPKTLLVEGDTLLIGFSNAVKRYQLSTLVVQARRGSFAQEQTVPQLESRPRF